MEIIKKHVNPLVKVPNYDGVCDECGCSQEIHEEFIAIEVLKTDDIAIVVPVDTWICPSCDKVIRSMRFYSIKSMEISSELRQIRTNF